MYITPHSKYYIEIYFPKGGKNSNKVIGNAIMADNLKKSYCMHFCLVHHTSEISLTKFLQEKSSHPLGNNYLLTFSDYFSLRNK